MTKREEPQMYYGAAYYPEQETPETIERDVRLMKELGFNAVRIAEFAWIKMEPCEGVYEWGWLDHAIERLGSQQIKSILCTPTACPPIWMVEAHPEIVYQDHRGIRRRFGARRHYCYNQPVYRDYCRKITAALVQRYGSNPHILGFHIDNELAQEVTGRCCCDVCRRKFQLWLEKKYGTIDHFNEVAGTVFWSQTYSRFDQIQPPLRTIETYADAQPIEMYYDNPTLRLEWERFCSESIIDFARAQQEVLRPHTDRPVTTNSTGMWTNGINYYDCFRELDVVAGDIYPSLRTDNMYTTSADYAFHRGIKNKPFWVVETSASGGHGVWQKEGVLQPYPGALRQNVAQAFACGAQVLTYFQWRAFRFGAEQLETCVIDIDEVPRRRHQEYQAAAHDLRQIEPLLADSRLVSQVAICYDYDTYWSTRIKPFNRDYRYQEQLLEIHKSLAQHGIQCDVIPCSDAIHRYKLVFVPSPVVMSDAFKKQLKIFVERRGVVVTNFLAAIRNEFHIAERTSPPAGLTDLFGIRVGEGEPVLRDHAPSTVAQISIQLGQTELSAPNRWWTEVLELQGAQPIAHYHDTFRAGLPVMASNAYGEGRAYYLGTWLPSDSLATLLQSIAAESGVQAPPISCSEGIEVIQRIRANGSPLYFVFNYRQSPTSVNVQRAMKDHLTGKTRQGDITMGAKEFWVLE